MNRSRDPRDIDITDPDKYFAYTNPAGSKFTLYVLKEDLERMKTEGELPKDGSFGTGGANYYKNTEGHYGGSGTIGYFLKAKEILEYFLQDPDFIDRCIEEGATDFLPEDVKDIFIF